VPEDALPESSVADGAQQRSGRTVLRDLLELVCPQLSFGCLRLGIATSRVEDLLLKLDEQPIYTRYKVGIMYCKAGQSTEEQMYNNGMWSKLKIVNTVISGAIFQNTARKRSTSFLTFSANVFVSKVSSSTKAGWIRVAIQPALIRCLPNIKRTK
jgi:hypothetical protein